MASFIQPGQNDAMEDCGDQRFQVYCNSVLGADKRFSKPFQYVNLTLGLTAAFTPIILYLIYIVLQSRTLKRRIKRPKNRKKGRKDGDVDRAETPMPAFRSTKSFKFLASNTDVSSIHSASQTHDLVVLPLSMGSSNDAETSSRTSQCPTEVGEEKMSLASVDIGQLGPEALDPTQVDSTADFLAKRFARNNLAGLALSCSTVEKPEQLDGLLERLYLSKIPVILSCHHDAEVIESLDFTYVAGLVIENAVILSSGERRDYFAAQRLRDVMGRCHKEREERSDFFIGFHDRWERRPHPAVVRRAVKLAEHLGAVIEHGPCDSTTRLKVPIVSATQTLSGFEYIRRAETIQLQKSWVSETRAAWIPDGSDFEEYAPLPLEDLDAVIPRASHLLRLRDLPGELEDIRDESPETHPPIDYFKLAPPRTNFWTSSSDGKTLSNLGCYKLTSEPHSDHYQAIIDTQYHLKELGMLHTVEGTEEQNLVTTLSALANRPGCDVSVQLLVKGLVDHNVRVYKGMDTGFAVTESDAHFWGVSKTREGPDDSCVDIFVSQKASSDAATVLHTWLAHSRIPRYRRYELELELELANDQAHPSGLPLSIRATIEQGTYSENLSLIQKLKVSELPHPIGNCIKDYCWIMLVEEPTKAAWNLTCAKGALDSEVSLRDIFRMRLEHYVRHGATELPSVDNLLRLYKLTNEVVIDGLFFGQRTPLNALTQVLLKAYDPSKSESDFDYVDINAELFALIYFTILRKAAFEEVYNESTDRCPMFISQPDQAAVFSELWILGSQCEIYFGLLPRDLGAIIYRRYRAFLETRPPTAADRRNNEIMTMYFTPDTSSTPKKDNDQPEALKPIERTPYETYQMWKLRFAEAGALSIFCAPAIIDVVLLTFLGRGFFMTAFMNSEQLEASGYALLIALLISAGVTGWVGSTGNYYLAHYAYDNMVYFHVQRLSGGFILTGLVSIVGLIMFSLRFSVSVGFVFVAYLICITTHFNLLGIMSAMHQLDSPLKSGRAVLLESMPLLFLAPLISSFVNGYDIAIYLPTMFCYVVLVLYRYRRLCHEWVNWMDNIPKFTHKDIMEWYVAREDPGSSDDDSKDQEALALETFTTALEAYQRRTKNARSAGIFADPLISRVAKGMPYVKWLFRRTNPGDSQPELFSTAWFTQLNESCNAQKGLIRGLKDHNAFTLYRLARYDVGQTLALFLVALMDRWLMIVWSAGGPYPSIYSDSRARYAICFVISYFCIGAMLLDSTLYKYWGLKDQMADERLKNFEHAQRLAEDFEVFRRTSILKALTDIMGKLLVVFGVATVLTWLFVDDWRTIVLYYMYSLGYTCVIIFQFNRCFTTNVTSFVTILFSSAALGFIAGCILHAIPATSQFLFNDLIGQNVASVCACLGTSMWTWKDWFAPPPAGSKSNVRDQGDIFVQRRHSAEESSYSKVPTTAMRKNFIGSKIWHEDGKPTSRRVWELLCWSLDDPNDLTWDTRWAQKCVQTARDMWASRKITVKIVSREEFCRAGLSDICSFSSQESSVLQLTLGFMGEAELSLPAWQSLLASVIAESILYHVARSQFTLSHGRAIQAEHFLYQTEGLSKRLEFELSFETPQHLARLSLKTEMELMRHLCLDFDVDAQWEMTPQSVREGIINRISGDPVKMTFEFNQWTDASKINMQTEDFHVYLTLQVYEKVQERMNQFAMFPDGIDTIPHPPAELRPITITNSPMPLGAIRKFWKKLVYVPFIFVKWVAIITGGASNIERELVYVLRAVPMRTVLVRFLLGIWSLCRIIKNFWIYWILIYHRPALANISRLAQKGARRKIVKNRIHVELPRKTITGFAAIGSNGTMELRVHNGNIKEEPSKGNPLFVDTYDEKLRLKSREDDENGSCSYQYDSHSRWPATKVIETKDTRSVGYYDKYGRVARGTWAVGDVEYVFQYHYKAAPKGNSDVLRVDYKLANSNSGDMLSVFWGKPVDIEDYNWTPSKNIGRIAKKIKGKIYISDYEYIHRRDPAITTYVQDANGLRTAVSKAPEVFAQEDALLARPKNVSFDTDDLLIYHSRLQVKQMRRYSGTTPSFVYSMNPISWIVLWNRRMYGNVPTWRLRTELWSHWLKSGTIDAVTACWMDELILREEPLLRRYWRARDSGRLEQGRAALDASIEQIVAAIDIDTDVSEVTLLTIKTTDLYAMGLSNDANEVTTRPQDCFNDTEERISVVFNDIGCWPVAPGGVSNCRRDLVNGHTTIRNHVMAECANDYGIPRFQIEKSVQSLKLLPLWGIDGGTANHGVIGNMLESQVDEKVADTDVQRDIVGVFIPLLMEFVKGARSRRLNRFDLVKYSNTILSMTKYYDYKDYTYTWASKEVEEAWAAAWLTHYDDPNILNPEEWFELERPTNMDFRIALGIFRAYFFIFAVKVPDECPRVFQSTHHGISSLFGLVLKHRRGANFGIWDHAILWRECCLNISAAQSELPLSVQATLLAGIGLATRLAYFHADVITPCASLFNPMWEIEIGTDKGTIGARNQFRRKVDPIVNGISNMDAFTPVDKIRTDTPTVVMLSNVQVIKGVKAALQAADIIVNRFGFKDYKLVIYGAKDRQPAYALEMEKFIVDNNLQERVILAGFGNPREVLKDAWLFMNSSISEGLPLAIGEAALAGVPIVATEVGATALVLTDTENPDQRYGEVVPPNDPVALARAQISILSMVGQWTDFTDEAGQKDVPTLPDDITANDVGWLSKRFYEKAEYRRQLGMLSRQVVLHSFHGTRYLREHEQMFWVQWHQGKMKADQALRSQTLSRFKFGAPTPLRYYEDDDKQSEEFEGGDEKETFEPIMLEQWRSSEANGEKGRVRRSKFMNRARRRTFLSPV